MIGKRCEFDIKHLAIYGKIWRGKGPPRRLPNVHVCTVRPVDVYSIRQAGTGL